MHIREKPGTTAKQSQRRSHPVTLNSRKNFYACVDTGADLCFVAPCNKQLLASLDRPMCALVNTSTSWSIRPAIACFALHASAAFCPRQPVQLTLARRRLHAGT
ncbi:BQ5605_C003g01965 [Microbotryum silenes-dioicae]|uniref:BQ5605_C003g01965 protein n=1 Tax=Microbotryum silenes-dioicae TaxID=796604 RepID=A0A2X0M0E6_9BASI|nr:BQ5605_C003g01965 [Microbotryum silenes-dioicae]